MSKYNNPDRKPMIGDRVVLNVKGFANFHGKFLGENKIYTIQAIWTGSFSGDIYYDLDEIPNDSFLADEFKLVVNNE